ncbi:hypothetical protein GJ700_02990 [Duganella sp. FT92W]|uniref:Uncharacterized protein n=1 Tax=Pseudoduganella rivuli TaxID=2666085 RepID=A0A7X2IIK1_9BURK|nr:hypothetical protein [Pseudoduganella rivuli]MRV70684.1 hypothetical protein [Pseudoduganella rivuli]
MTALDKNTVHDTLGTLLEMARRDQDAIHAAVEQLKYSQRTLDQMTRQLPGEMAQRVDKSLQNSVDGAANKLASHFSEANVQADLAAATYQRASKHVVIKITLAALGITAIAAASIVAVTWILAPTNADIQALREERDELKRQITFLERKGGRSDVTMCKLDEKTGKSRMCAKIDSSFKGVWEGGYLIIANKD